MASSAELFSQFGPNSGYIEELYQLYLSDPGLVGDSWAAFFSALKPGTNGATASAALASTNGTHAITTATSADLELQEKVFRLVEAYRQLGHFAARINPLTSGVRKLPFPTELDLATYGFTEGELSRTVLAFGFQGKKTIELRALINELPSAYSGSIGFEFTHILDTHQRQWLQEKIENRRANRMNFSNTAKLHMLAKLIEAEGLESELHKTYVGSKRFSIQGGETAIAMLDSMESSIAIAVSPP